MDLQRCWVTGQASAYRWLMGCRAQAVKIQAICPLRWLFGFSFLHPRLLSLTALQSHCELVLLQIAGRERVDFIFKYDWDWEGALKCSCLYFALRKIMIEEKGLELIFFLSTCLEIPNSTFIFKPWSLKLNTANTVLAAHFTCRAGFYNIKLNMAFSPLTSRLSFWFRKHNKEY